MTAKKKGYFEYLDFQNYLLIHSTQFEIFYGSSIVYFEYVTLSLRELEIFKFL